MYNDFSFSVSAGSPVIKDTPEHLTDKQLNEAQVAVDVFGQEIVSTVSVLHTRASNFFNMGYLPGV